MASLTYGDLALQTLPEDTLAPPECRMQSAASVVDAVNQAIQDDADRSRVRARVDGLVDGNPPADPAKLKANGMAKKTNVNFGTARSFLQSGADAVYDLATQAPGVVQIETSYGTPEERVRAGRILSEELDYSINVDEDWDNHDQISQNEMILHGCGPLIFEDEDSVFPVAITTDNFKIPDRAPSVRSRWEICFALRDYYPPELFQFIVNEESAQRVGWRINRTKLAIARAMDEKSPDNKSYDWEWYQNQIKTKSSQYVGSQTKVSKMAHCWWTEFPQPGERRGRITHAIVERTGTTDAANGYCFIRLRRYSSWNQCVHPMYYDRGRGGLHHNVTGLGVKMYGAMKLQNITLCRTYDAANSPKLLFTTTSEKQFTQSLGADLRDNAILKPGVTPVPTPLSGVIGESLALLRTSDDLTRSNLSAYRQPVAPERSGNPATATEKRMEAMQQSAVSATQFSRWYKQRDLLLTEIVRRFCNLNSTDPRAVEWQQRCRERGVAPECFGRIRRVRAIRVVGQGSPFIRIEALRGIGQIIASCPESGQAAWRRDMIAAHAGGEAVARYYPEETNPQSIQDQRVMATMQVGLMRLRLAPEFSEGQNSITFAGKFLEAAAGALEGVQKGAAPEEVLEFLNLAMPAAAAHIGRLQSDPLRKEVADLLDQRWKQIAKIADHIKKSAQAQAGQQQQLRQKQQGVLSDAQIKAQATAAKLQLAKQKQDATLTMRREAHDQALAINDSRAAADIHLNKYRALSQ